MEKAEIREKYKQLRKQLEDSEIDSFSMKIANRSLELAIWDKTYYHIYLPIRKFREVNTEYLLHIIQGRDKSVVLSKSDMKTGTMTHLLLQENTLIREGAFGIPEPEDGIEISPELLDVVFVPLLAFNEDGHRVGYGKGYYDRFLAKCRPDCLKIGLSFFEAEPFFIHEIRDFPLDCCITPKKIHCFKNSNLYL